MVSEVPPLASLASLNPVQAALPLPPPARLWTGPGAGGGLGLGLTGQIPPQLCDPCWALGSQTHKTNRELRCSYRLLSCGCVFMPPPPALHENGADGYRKY